MNRRQPHISPYGILKLPSIRQIQPIVRTKCDVSVSHRLLPYRTYPHHEFISFTQPESYARFGQLFHSDAIGDFPSRNKNHSFRRFGNAN